MGSRIHKRQWSILSASKNIECRCKGVFLNFLKWNDNVTARELKSVEEIVAAQNNGELNITETNIIVNSPAVKW